MAFDVGRLTAGILIYVPVVILPTVSVMLEHEGIHNVFVERVLTGVLAYLGGMLMWHGIRGEPAGAGTQAWYPGFRPVFFLVAIAVLGAAWFTNLPNALAGSVGEDVLVSTRAGVVPLNSLWGRIVGTGMTMIGVALLRRAFITNLPPEQQRDRRVQRRAARKARKQAMQAEAFTEAYE